MHARKFGGPKFRDCSQGATEGTFTIGDKTFVRHDGGQNSRMGTLASGDWGQNSREGMFARHNGDRTVARERSYGTPFVTKLEIAYGPHVSLHGHHVRLHGHLVISHGNHVSACMHIAFGKDG